MYYFGYFPYVWLLYADVSEHSICSIFIGSIWSASYPAYEDGTDRVFRNVGIQQSDAREIPTRIHTRFKTQRKFEINKLHVTSRHASVCSRTQETISRLTRTCDRVTPDHSNRFQCDILGCHNLHRHEGGWNHGCDRGRRVVLRSCIWSRGHYLSCKKTVWFW